MNIEKKSTISQHLITRYLPLALILIGFAVRVAYIGVDSLHEDEAVYAYWARLIASGRDPLLLDVLVDKPPIYLYLLAAAFKYIGTTEVIARFVNVLFSTITVAICYALVRRMYDANTALLAALFMALSPFNILFAPTLFTDPLLVLFVLAALWAVVLRRDFAAGLLIGLATATKQHGWLFLPLVFGMQWARDKLPREKGRSTLRPYRSRYIQYVWVLAGVALVMLPTVWWDAQRWELRPSYFEQSARTYGGLHWTDFAEWRERGAAWRTLLSYITASRIMNWGLVITVPLWLWRRRTNAYDLIWLSFGTGLVAFYFFGQFSTWDRYLLGIVPIVAIITARVVLSFRAEHNNAAYPLIAAAVLAMLLIPGTFRAVRRDLPIGSDHWAYRGLDVAVHYVQENVPSGAIVYHNQLGWHLAYYLFDADYDLRAYTNALEVVDNYLIDRQYPAPAYLLVATARPAAPLVTRAEEAGLRITPLVRMRRGDGSLGFVVREMVTISK